MLAHSRRIGVISNPRSHAYRAGLKNAIAAHIRSEVAEPASMAELLATLTRFAAEAVDLLIVHGGDGTLRDVLSLLPEAYPEDPPDLAILAAGNTNLAARIFGRIRPGSYALARFLQAAETGRLRRSVCHTLQVAWPDVPDRSPVRGFFLGAALYADGKRIADAELHRRGLHHGLAVGLAVTSALVRMLARRNLGLWQGTPMRIAPHASPARDGQCLVFLATTLNRLMLGFWPFGGVGDGAIHWLDIEAPPRRLAGALVTMLLHRPKPDRAAHGHHGGRASRIALRLTQPFVLDGEFFDPGPAGRIVLSAGGAVTILRP